MNKKLLAYFLFFAIAIFWQTDAFAMCTRSISIKYIENNAWVIKKDLQARILNGLELNNQSGSGNYAPHAVYIQFEVNGDKALVRLKNFVGCGDILSCENVNTAPLVSLGYDTNGLPWQICFANSACF